MKETSKKWYDENKSGNLVVKGNGYVIINAQDKIRSTIIGTLASILSKSNGSDEKFIMSMAQLADGLQVKLDTGSGTIRIWPTPSSGNG